MKRIKQIILVLQLTLELFCIRLITSENRRWQLGRTIFTLGGTLVMMAKTKIMMMIPMLAMRIVTPKLM